MPRGTPIARVDLLKTAQTPPKGAEIVWTGEKVDPKVARAARRASEMVWGARSKGLSRDFEGC